jgi:hypothetical protein
MKLTAYVKAHTLYKAYVLYIIDPLLLTESIIINYQNNNVLKCYFSSQEKATIVTTLMFRP